jgi:uncharacterized phage protein (predicted DNA packaging)
MIVDLDTVKLQLRVDFGDEDVTIERKIAAAQNLIERHLGYKIEDQFGGVDQDEIPASLIEAVCQLVGHWFENREAVLVGVNAQELPMNVRDIIREYRNWSW